MLLPSRASGYCRTKASPVNPSRIVKNRKSGQEDGIRPRDLAVDFTNYLNWQLMICVELEAIADSLPVVTNNQAAQKTAEALPSLLKRAHAFEENELFSLLLKNQHITQAFKDTIERLQTEHLGDEDFAQDIHNAIQDYLVEMDRSKAESLGWMLRGFFENIRRHIAFEREYILPLAKQIGSNR